jgi:hypothetical protein
MKLSRLLPLVVGGAVAGMVVSGTSPAQALTWNWSATGTGISAGGTFTTNDTPDGSGFYTISAITGNHNGNAITIVSPGGVGGNDNLISQSNPQLSFNGIGYTDGGGTYYNIYWDGPQYFSGFNFDNTFGLQNETPVSFTASASAAVPFDTPAGQAIATFGSLFALGLMRKAKKRLAAKKVVLDSVETAV